MTRVGIVGLGGIAGIHLSAYKRIDNVKVVAVVDSLGKNAVNYDMIKDTDIKLYDSLDEMLKKESLDIVDICAPSHLHTQMSVFALEHGLNVLCEKPMATSFEDAKKIVMAAQQSGKKFMTAQVIRFSKPYMYLKSVVDSGELGAPVQIFVKRLSAVPRWRLQNMNADSKKNGGVMLDLAIHDVDFIYSVFGTPDSIDGVYHPVGASDYNDYIAVNLNYGRLNVNLCSGFYKYGIPFKSGYLAIFENGYLELEDGRLYKCGELLPVSDTVYQDEGAQLNISMSENFISEIRYFVECVENNADIKIAAMDSTAAAIELAENIIKKTKTLQ